MAVAADAHGARKLRSARLRPGDQQRVGAGQGRDCVFFHAAHLLLPHSHALLVGPLPGLSQRVDPVALEARRHGAASPNYLRLWDFASAARVDHFIANSENVADAHLEEPIAARPRSFIRRWMSSRSIGSLPKTTS